MTIYSKTYPGHIKICEQCGCLFSFEPCSDLYEEKYVYCPLCHYKLDSGIREAEWRYAIERREEAQLNDKKDINGADSSTGTV